MKLTKQAKSILDSQIKLLKDINNFKDDEIIVTFLMLYTPLSNNKKLDVINLKLKTKNNVTLTSYIFKDAVLAKYLKDKLDSNNQYVCNLFDIEPILLDAITESERKLLNALTTKVDTFTVMYKEFDDHDNITYVYIVTDDFSFICNQGNSLIPESISFKFKGDVLPSLENYYNYTYQIIQELILNNGI